MVQSEGDIAKLYKGRYEDITQEIVGADKSSNNMVKCLKLRLDREAVFSDHQVSLRREVGEELRNMTT